MTDRVVAREPGRGDAMYLLDEVVRVLRRIGDDRFYEIGGEEVDRG